MNKEQVDSSKIRLLSIGTEDVEFLYLKMGQIEKKIGIEIGYKIIAGRYFKNEIPNEAEIESAINYIEDELMRTKELQNYGEVLYCSDKEIIEILEINGNAEKVFVRQEIEDIFTRYAMLSLGQVSSQSTIKMSREKYAEILVLREIMHHLDFEEITIKS